MYILFDKIGKQMLEFKTKDELEAKTFALLTEYEDKHIKCDAQKDEGGNLFIIRK